MEEIVNIYYTDSYYGDNPEVPSATELPRCEAYGFTFEREGCFFVHFIKKVGEETRPDDFIKGLIIPKRAVVSYALRFTSKEEFIVGESVAIRWSDVVYVANTKRSEVSVMETTGQLFRDAGNHVVIKNPKTIRKHPLPMRGHPKEQPSYYVIPKSLIEGPNETLEMDIKKDERQDDGNRLVRVRFHYGDNDEYECVGIFMWERDGNTRIAFNALNNEVEDFLDIPTVWIKRTEELSDSEAVVFK